MDMSTLKMDRSEARELYEKYRAATYFGGPIDKEIARTYRLIGQGKVIIRALESIKAAGLDEEGLPKLAIIRADAAKCHLGLGRDGSARFANNDGTYWSRRLRNKWECRLPPGTFPPRQHSLDTREAIVPIVPAHLRPKADIANYHILWEADWHMVPRDPLLLRRLSKGDLWLVVAAWELTEVERAALQARV
jgi:hypothetical protein